MRATAASMAATSEPRFRAVVVDTRRSPAGSRRWRGGERGLACHSPADMRFTSSHGMPTDGSRRNSACRRSSSAANSSSLMPSVSADGGSRLSSSPATSSARSSSDSWRAAASRLADRSLIGGPPSQIVPHATARNNADRGRSLRHPTHSRPRRQRLAPPPTYHKTSVHRISPPGDDMPSIDELAVNTIRTLAMDAVQQANSGHPGTPMALAPVIYTLYQEVMSYDPADPTWPNRDRFVLSAGHASMLLYSTLHLAGVKQFDHNGRPTGELAVTLDQIKRFRQLHSRTPGHPESFLTSGVETTTGPLGQGLGNSVGMAMAGRWLAHYFNRPNFKLFDFHVWVICSDGDLMEGISSEAASLAGHLKLPNLCWIYDNNRTTIDGKTDLAFSEDVATRFQGYRWNTLHVADANDRAAIAAALQVAKGTIDRPTLIIVDSHIGFGAPKKQDTSDAHGEPLGEEEIKGAKRNYGWPENEKFLVPEGVREHFAQGIGALGARARELWQTLSERYRAEY